MLKLYRVYQAYYMTHQLSDQEPSRIAWIGSLQFYLVFSAGVLGGPLFDLYGAKVGTITDSDPCPLTPISHPIWRSTIYLGIVNMLSWMLFRLCGYQWSVTSYLSCSLASAMSIITSS